MSANRQGSRRCPSACAQGCCGRERRVGHLLIEPDHIRRLREDDLPPLAGHAIDDGHRPHRRCRRGCERLRCSITGIVALAGGLLHAAGSYGRIRGSARDLRGRSNCVGAAAQRAVRRDCPGGRENRCKGPRADRDSGGGYAQPPVSRPGVLAQRSAELVNRHGYARESRVKPCGPNLAGKILNPSFTMPLKLLFTRSGACTKNTQKYKKSGRHLAAPLTQQ
jgi:hypothetical protein